MRAIGMFIFAGSATFGAEAAGYKVEKILEMTDNMKDLNAYHFNKNRPDVPIILPEEWENNDYLEKLKEDDLDLLYANCPCSSLSQINRNASVDGKNNVHFYRLFNAINTIQPKAFLIENAPTLIKLGYPILKDMFEKIDGYKFTIIRDYAGNHGVPMKRMRTLLVGWKEDEFNGKIPLLHMNKEDKVTCKDVIGDLYNKPLNDPNLFNHELVTDDPWAKVENLFGNVSQGTSALLAFADQWSILKSQVTEKRVISEVEKTIEKIKNDKRLWDKTPWRVRETDICPSMTSVTKIIHPINDRTFTIREYARLMGYPDSFEFHDDCKVPVIQCIAQGVPANFIKYITSEIKEAINGNRELIDEEDQVMVFQHHTHEVWKAYTQEELDTIKLLEHKTKKDFNKLEK